MKVQNKKIIVTGSGNGIGRELTIQLIKKGAFVIGLDINDEGLDQTAFLVDQTKFLKYKIDISNENDIYAFKKYCVDNNIIVDGLINNAGIIQPFINVNELDNATINKVMNINFYGPLKLIKMFLPDFLKMNEAHIVNVSSMGGFFPFPGQTIYGASKSALKMLSEGLYAELLDTNVHVTAVFPGAIATNIAKNSNVDFKSTTDTKMKMTSPVDAAEMIIDAMENNKFQVYVGSDSKFMNFLYKMNPKGAIKFINKQMKKM